MTKPFQVDEFVTRRPITDVVISNNQTPVFIGTASQLVSITTTDGSESIPIVNPQDGVTFDLALTEAILQYWNNVGSYTITTVDPTNTILYCSTNYQNESILLGQQQYVCFFLDISGGANNGNVVATASLSSGTFTSISGQKLVNTLVLNEPLPANILAHLSNYELHVCYINTYKSQSTDFSITSNTLNFNPTDINLFGANNVDYFITTNWSLYFDVTDSRTYMINATDPIPPELATTVNNQLGQALAYHRAISPTVVCLLTVPAPTDDNANAALATYQANSQLSGYFVVILFNNFLALFPPPQVLQIYPLTYETVIVVTDSLPVNPLALQCMLVSGNKTLTLYDYTGTMIVDFKHSMTDTPVDGNFSAITADNVATIGYINGMCYDEAHNTIYFIDKSSITLN